MAVEHRPVADLIPYARNARTHSDAQVAEIAASIRAFGWTNPILVDGENGIIAGHGRLLAARKLKLGTVPVIELSGLSEVQKRAYILADNRLALNAGWDDDLLAAEIADLDALGFDLSLAGFGDGEVGRLIDLFQQGSAPSFPRRGAAASGEGGQPARRSVAHGRAPAALRRRYQAGRPLPGTGGWPGRHGLHRPALQRGLSGWSRDANANRQ